MQILLFLMVSSYWIPKTNGHVLCRHSKRYSTTRRCYTITRAQCINNSVKVLWFPAPNSPMFILVPCEVGSVLLAAFLMSAGLFLICSSILKRSCFTTAGHSFCPSCQDLTKDAEGITWSLIEHNRSLKTRWRPAARGGRPGGHFRGHLDPQLAHDIWMPGSVERLPTPWEELVIHQTPSLNLPEPPTHKYTHTHTHTEFPIGPLLAVCVRSVEELFAPSFPAVYSRVRTSHMT